MARSRKARPQDVDEICGALPETEFGTSWGDRPTWKVPRGPKAKGFLLYRAPSQNATEYTGTPTSFTPSYEIHWRKS